jgi:PST family polysaccharide transporter
MNEILFRLLPHFIYKRLEGRNNLLRILNNTSWLFADRILRMGVGLFVGVWIARYLGPEQFGIYNYAIAFVALFGALATLGLDGIVVRDIVRSPSSKGEILGTAFMLKLCGGILTLLFTLGSIYFLRPNDSLTRWLVGIIAAGTIFQAFDTIDFWFQSQIQSKFTVYAKNAAFLLITFIKLALIITKAQLIAFAWAASLEVIIGAFGLVVIYHTNGYSFRTWCVTSLHAKKLLKDSWPLIISGVAIMIYVKIDLIMLGEIIGNKAVGIYSAATRISEVWYFIPTAIVSSMSPLIIETKRLNETLYYHWLQKTFNIMAVLAYSIAVPMTFLSNYLILTLYGPSFNEAGTILAIHIWSGLFVFLGVARGVWIITEGFTKIALITTTSGAVANILLNFYLIPKYGPVGAAIATLISYGFSDYFMFILIPNFRKIGKLMTNAIMLRFLYRNIYD